jgi:hypothetical protein
MTTLKQQRNTEFNNTIKRTQWIQSMITTHMRQKPDTWTLTNLVNQVAYGAQFNKPRLDILWKQLTANKLVKIVDELTRTVQYDFKVSNQQQLLPYIKQHPHGISLDHLTLDTYPQSINDINTLVHDMKIFKIHKSIQKEDIGDETKITQDQFVIFPRRDEYELTDDHGNLIVIDDGIKHLWHNVKLPPEGFE